MEDIEIEKRILVHYKAVRTTFEKVLAEWQRDQNIPCGICASILKWGKMDNRLYLWREVIKPWFTPERFNITTVYFNYPTTFFGEIKEEYIIIKGIGWYKIPIEKLPEWMHGAAFWFPLGKDYAPHRIKILECALEDLERIKREGEPKLPPLTFEEPKIYP